jgi:hypothetical protein
VIHTETKIDIEAETNTGVEADSHYDHGQQPFMREMTTLCWQKRMRHRQFESKRIKFILMAEYPTAVRVYIHPIMITHAELLRHHIRRK